MGKELIGKYVLISIPQMGEVEAEIIKYHSEYDSYTVSPIYGTIWYVIYRNDKFPTYYSTFCCDFDAFLEIWNP